MAQADPGTAEALIGPPDSNGNGDRHSAPGNTGLAVARRVVGKHRGVIQVVTEQSVGSTAFFTL